MATQKEREDHMLTHLPYRSWCKVCVAARGYSHAHGFVEHDEGEDPLVALDYLFLGERETPGCLVNLCVKDTISKVLLTVTVPQKGENA